jgi:Papain family cysteine protease
MTGLPHQLGAKPDRPDPRDYLFASRPLASAAAAIDRKFYTMVGPDFRINQGNEGTCVGHAATNVMLAGPSEHDDYLPFATEESAHQFARKLYLEASGDASYQGGMAPRAACAKLLEWGLIDSYWRVLQVDDITTALLTFGPVMLGVPWYFSMFDDQRSLSKVYGNWWIKVNMDSDLAGYHEVALTGIDLDPDDGAPPWVRVQNSWGSGWGWNGTARLTLENLRRLNLLDNWTFAEKAF